MGGRRKMEEGRWRGAYLLDLTSSYFLSSVWMVPVEVFDFRALVISATKSMITITVTVMIRCLVFIWLLLIVKY